MNDWITPDWPAPKNIRAITTTRNGGFSQTPYDSMNISTYVGDDPEAVQKNRQYLQSTLNIPSQLHWLEQVHGTLAVNAAHITETVKADACYSSEKNIICTIQTADCLPVLLCDKTGTTVAAIHAGWRGLADGIIEQAINTMNCPGNKLIAWLGPAIGPKAFESGDDVRDAFIAHDKQAKTAFTQQTNGLWLADIYELARQRLTNQGVTACYGGNFCTYHDEARFYSFRRDQTTGRMATLIWLT